MNKRTTTTQSPGHLLSLLLLPLLLLVAMACGDGVVRGPEKREAPFVAVKVQLPPEGAPQGSEIYIRIIEISGPDRALVGSFKGPAGLPEYRVEYRRARIREAQTYALELVVMSNGKPVMQNRKPYFVITKGHPEQVTAELESRPGAPGK